MSLTVVSTPIGNDKDITLRAIETLTCADIIICEEMKPARTLLKGLGVDGKELICLNEHSVAKDIPSLTEICSEKSVALISDCGTPGFYDPGSALVADCLFKGITVDVNPGASSLMALIALSGEFLTEFHFVGFLPQRKEERAQKLRMLRDSTIPLVVMDTPYRLKQTVSELAARFPLKRAVLGIDLTGDHHQLLRAPLKQLAEKELPKAPFVILILPQCK